MAKKPTKAHVDVASNEQSIKGFAILENALRITLVIIKIAIAVMVPKGQHIYDPGVVF